MAARPPPSDPLEGRPYLQARGKPHPSEVRHAPAASCKLDIHKLLASTAPVSWGALLGTLPATITQSLLEEAKQAN